MRERSRVSCARIFGILISRFSTRAAHTQRERRGAVVSRSDDSKVNIVIFIFYAYCTAATNISVMLQRYVRAAIHCENLEIKYLMAQNSFALYPNQFRMNYYKDHSRYHVFIIMNIMNIFLLFSNWPT